VDIVIDPKGDVWRDNPHLELIKVFRDFKAKYGEEQSSRILKAVYYLYDVRSPLRDTPKSFDEMVEDVNDTVIKDPKFNWGAFQFIVDAYSEHVPTKAQAEMRRYEDEISGLHDFLATWAWGEDNVKEKADALIKAEKLWAIFLKLKDQVTAENTASGSYGGYKKSKIESYRD
jgi:hypothetical protein